VVEPTSGYPSILIFSEDSAKEASPTLRLVVLQMLGLVDSESQSGITKIEPGDELHNPAVHANFWKSKEQRDHKKIADLVMYTGEMLASGRFVLFHVDGDCVWRKRRRCDTEKRFQKVIGARVRQVVGMAKPVKEGRIGLDECMQRLVLIMPYYSIEAWLYQNTKVAVALCHRHHQGLHADKFAHWEQHRDELDEAEKVRDTVCLHSKHNLELAGDGFPAKEVHDVKKSFAEAVGRLRLCAPLVAALAKTRHTA